MKINFRELIKNTHKETPKLLGISISFVFQLFFIL